MRSTKRTTLCTSCMFGYLINYGSIRRTKDTSLLFGFLCCTLCLHLLGSLSEVHFKSAPFQNVPIILADIAFDINQNWIWQRVSWHGNTYFTHHNAQNITLLKFREGSTDHITWFHLWTQSFRRITRKFDSTSFDILLWFITQRRWAVIPRDIIWMDSWWQRSSLNFIRECQDPTTHQPPIYPSIYLIAWLWMINLSDGVRRQHCARLGAITLLKLNQDKGKTNLLPSRTVGQNRGIALSTLPICHFVWPLCASASEHLLQIPLDSSKRCLTTFLGLTGNLSLGVQDYNLCKPLVNGKVLIHS